MHITSPFRSCLATNFLWVPRTISVKSCNLLDCFMQGEALIRLICFVAAHDDFSGDPDCCTADPPWRARQACSVGGDQGCDQIHLWLIDRLTASNPHPTWCFSTPPTTQCHCYINAPDTTDHAMSLRQCYHPHYQNKTNPASDLW